MMDSVPIFHRTAGGSRRLAGWLREDGVFVMHKMRSILNQDGKEILKHYFQEYGGYASSVDVILQLSQRCKLLWLIEKRCDGTEHVWKTTFTNFIDNSTPITNRDEAGDLQRVLNLKYWHMPGEIDGCTNQG